VGIDLNRYLARLEDPSRGEARFFVRNDNLRFWLELVAKRLGDLAHRLSGSVGIEELETYAIWDLTADKPPTEVSELAYKTPWLEVDDRLQGQAPESPLAEPDAIVTMPSAVQQAGDESMVGGARREPVLADSYQSRL